ncbi:MAG: O-antigen ligase family protein [Xanthobacteraceae bacterium]
MTDFAASYGSLPPALVMPRVAALQRGLLWLVGCSGAVVFFEPSPYELTTLLAMVVLVATGLSLRLAFLPLAAMLFLVNIGYTICAADLMNQSRIVTWILTSWYMAITAIFFAMAVAQDTYARLDFLRRGLIFGALIASLAGIAGYFRLFPGAYGLFTLYGRAMGPFKDPNVFSAFLVLPALFLLQSVVSDRFGKALRSTLVLGIITLALLLAFSRAAWGQFIIASAFMLFMMVLTSRTNIQRSRIITLSVAALLMGVVLLLVLLSFDSIDTIFKQRASFDQSYDEGRFGRFGRHILGARMALDLPFGIGPLQFTKFFPEDTHNSYLNAFMSGGWISGVCYPALISTTVVLGFRYAFVRTPWQRVYLAVFATFLGTVGEAFIIDTDHWRHFWMMMGLMWGMFAANQQHIATARRSWGAAKAAIGWPSVARA